MTPPHITAVEPSRAVSTASACLAILERNDVRGYVHRPNASATRATIERLRAAGMRIEFPTKTNPPRTIVKNPAAKQDVLAQLVEKTVLSLPSPFRSREVIDALAKRKINVSHPSVCNVLRRMVKQNRITMVTNVRTGFGGAFTYAIVNQATS